MRIGNRTPMHRIATPSIIFKMISIIVLIMIIVAIIARDDERNRSIIVFDANLSEDEIKELVTRYSQPCTS